MYMSFVDLPTDQTNQVMYIGMGIQPRKFSLFKKIQISLLKSNLENHTSRTDEHLDFRVATLINNIMFCPKISLIT